MAAVHVNEELVALTCAEKVAEKMIAQLGEQITAYILKYQDDAAQQDHWRTTMQRKMSMQHAAIDEVHQLVKKLANANQD